MLSLNRVHATLRKAGFRRSREASTTYRGHTKPTEGYRLAVIPATDTPTGTAYFQLRYHPGYFNLTGTGSDQESEHLARYLTTLQAAGIKAEMQGNTILMDAEQEPATSQAHLS